jgi:site-specific DNA recombinase
MTVAAIYSRKSSEQQGLNDEEKSIHRQIVHAKDYAARKGWMVAEEFIYVDDGVSGAEFARRPGFIRLMSALKPQPPFQVLIMSEESRLGREAIETAYALKQLITAGVRVFFYLEDRERTLHTPIDKVLMSVTGFADEVERDKARQRTYDALLRKATSLHVTGGRVFGYDNREVLGEIVGPDGRRKRLYVERVINHDEAPTVRRIFDMCANGDGIRRIAIALNDNGIVAPVPRRLGRSRSWAPSTIREILHRPLYRGEVVWNRIKKRDQWGQKKYVRRPEKDWLRLPAPDLRIVSDELWNRAHARLAELRAAYVRTNGGRLWGRPRSGVDAKYLLTGLAQCGCCNGSLIVKGRDYRKGRKYAYACAYNHLRGRLLVAIISKVRWILLTARFYRSLSLICCGLKFLKRPFEKRSHYLNLPRHPSRISGRSYRRRCFSSTMN